MGQDSPTSRPSGHTVYKRRFYALRVLRNHYIENRDQPLFLHTVTKKLEERESINRTLRDADIKPILDYWVKKGFVEIKNPGAWESYMLTPVGLDWYNMHGSEIAWAIFDSG